jgi:hypothetical protein
MHDSLCFPVKRIDVDPNFPEDCGPFFLAPFRDNKIDNDPNFKDGWIINFHGDIGDYLDDKYTARKISSNTVLISKPRLSKSYLECYDQQQAELAERGHKDHEDYSEVERNGHTVVRNKYSADPARQMKHYAVCFPCPIDNTDYKDEDGELVCNPFTYESRLKYDEETIERTKDLIFWRIGKYEEEPRRHLDAPPPSTTKGLARLQKMKNRI